jgi:protein ImuB
LVHRLFAERIEALADPIDPGFGFDLVRLAVPVLEPLAPTQLALEGGEVRDGELIALIDRLSTRLGRTRVRRLVPRDTHIPEQAALALPAIEAPAPAPWPAPAPGEPPLRPIHLFDPPQPIEVIAEVPDGPPKHFRWRRTSHSVTRYEGPERIAAEWWTRDDNAGLTRDYYRIEDARGRRFWVFRHGLYRETERPRWYVHGVFA